MGWYEDATLSGKEGYIDFIWGDGLGGACANPVDETIQLKDDEVYVCHVTSDTKETWALFKPKGVNADTQAGANSPFATNRVIVLKILSTYESMD